MKQCPQCKSTYSDESLRYCLADGMTLEDLDTEKTEVLNLGDTIGNKPAAKTGDEAIRVRVADDDEKETVEARSRMSGDAGAVRKGVSLFAFGLLTGALLLVIAGLSGFIAYSRLNKDGTDAARTSEIEKLKKQVVLLENQLGFGAEIKARVNTPGDGFLALRGQPDSDKGERITKIPHGSVIRLGICQSKSVVIGKRKGRWCRAMYQNQTGWIFDAWVVRD